MADACRLSTRPATRVAVRSAAPRGGVPSAGSLRVPAGIADLAAEALSASEVELTWTAPAGGVIDYQYRVDGGAWAEATPSPFTVSGLDAGTLYAFEVRSINGNGPSPVSNVAQATTQGADDTRITEAGDIRITEVNDTRVLETA